MRSLGVPLLAALLVSSACASAPLRGGGTTVEAVLRETAGIQVDLDTEYGYDVEEGASWRELPFRWPLKRVRFNSRFGRRGGRPHAGVDLDARTGTPVTAALGGVVVFADDRISGYGDVVMIRHVLGVSTLYAHCSELLVREGDWVIQGQRIALSGETGRASGPHLHFEIRDKMIAVDPQGALSGP